LVPSLLVLLLFLGLIGLLCPLTLIMTGVGGE
jgi:hypothetical protein